MDNLDIFSRLNLDVVPVEWVNLIWADNFLTFDDPPDDFLGQETDDLNATLKQICAVTSQWVKNSVRDPERISWRVLKANLNTRCLLAVLGYLIRTGQRLGASEDARQSCLRATSLYLSLLSIPEGNVHVSMLFQPMLFQLATDTFKLVDHLVPTTKKSRAVDLVELYDEDPEVSLTAQEKVTLTQGLNSIMFDVISLLQKFNLKDHERSLEVLVNCLVEVAKAETSVNPLSRTEKSKACLATLSYNAYMALKALCEPNHGVVEVTVRLILKYIMQHFLISHLDLPTRNANILKESILQFLRRLLESHGKDAKLGFTILVQHLMVKCPDRLEARQKQAPLVARIITICRDKLFIKNIETLVLCAHNPNKVNLRVFSLEVTRSLLFDTGREEIEQKESRERKKVQKILIGIVLAKCSDMANTARGKAMAILAELTEEKNLQAFENEFEMIFSTDNQLPNLELLRSALNEDTDVLPGADPFLQMLFRRAEDDRALIRRSSLQILRNLMRFKGGLTDLVIPLIGRHCRDLSMAVRKFAIQMLTQMLRQSPTNEMLLEEWVRSMIHPTFDIESKVQEEALEAMDQLIFKKIEVWNGARGDDSAELPWRIVEKMIQLEMRKLLEKTSCKNVDKSVVTRVRTHLGTVHEVQAWVLLAIFSEQFVPANMEGYFENYNELIRSNEYHVKYMLLVLRNCVSKLDRELLQRMQADFYQSLCQFEVSVEYISICIDILIRVMKFLQPNGEKVLQSNMLTLMKSSEAKVNKIFNEEDSADVCPLRVMSTLGYASLACTGSVTSSTLHILQGMLLDWDSVPGCLQRSANLRQCGIRLLGQLSIRDREVAEQVTPILCCLMFQTGEDQSPSDTSIRVDAAKVLADLCERFTALVEPFLPEMCVCMKDPNPKVREAIVEIFTQLLLEDFIKVKGLFFFHILTMISDPDETVRELTIFLIKERLIVKNKALIYQQFTRSIFHYNDCTSHQKVGVLKMTDKEKAVLMLSGLKNESKRRTIYDFMLEHVDPLYKVKLIESLTSSILNGFCEDVFKLEGENEKCLLRDTLYILSSDYIQPNFSINKQNEDEMQEEGVTPANVHNNLINFLTQTAKNIKLQQLMPLLVKLEAKLKDMACPLEADVKKFFIQLVLEYSKETFISLLNEYPDLEDKIENIRKHGKKQLTDDETKEKSVEDEKLFNATVLISRLKVDKIAMFTKSPSATPTGRRSTNPIDDTLMISPIQRRGSKKPRSRSSSSTSTYSALHEIATSTPISFEKPCENVVLDDRLNALPEFTDDESSND